MNVPLAVIGATALWLTYAWLASAIAASYLSGLKGYGERPGLASGLLLNAAGVLIWLLWPPRAAAAERGELATKWMVARVLMLTVLSAGIYWFYWYFHTRRILDRELGTEHNSALETAGLAVPLLNLVLLYRLFRDIGAARERQGLGRSPAAVYALLCAIPVVDLIPLALAVRDYDEMWDETGRGAVHLGITLRESLLVAAGFVVLVAAILLLA
jgi:hypothetical protein